MTRRAFPLALVAALGLISCSQGAAADPPTTHTVIIADMRFQPETLTVKAGDAIVWINKDLFPHTATSEAGGFNSAGIDAGSSWQHVPKAKGTFAYVCSFHPTMKATLRVE